MIKKNLFFINNDTKQILVHGEATEMGRLKKALEREYEDDAETNIVIHTPENKSSVQLEFRFI